DIHYTYGIGLAALARIDEAAENFRCALELRPDHVLARIELARMLILQRRREEATVHLNRALDLDSTCAVALFYLGKILQGQNEYGRALDCYRRAAAIDPENAGPHCAAMERLLLPD